MSSPRPTPRNSIRPASTSRGVPGKAAHAPPKPVATPAPQPKPTPKKEPRKIKRRAALALMLGLATAPLVIGAFATRRWRSGSAIPAPGFVTLDRVVSNLDGGLRLQLKVAIETPDAESAQIISHYAPKLRSMMFLTAGEFEEKELRTPQGKADLADTLVEVFRNNVDRERAALIVAVHFLEFLLGD